MRAWEGGQQKSDHNDGDDGDADDDDHGLGTRYIDGGGATVTEGQMREKKIDDFLITAAESNHRPPHFHLHYSRDMLYLL